MPPAKVETAVPKPEPVPTRMPAAPAEMVPLLLMPPEKVEMTADAFWDAWPPTKMPFAPAEIGSIVADAAGERRQRDRPAGAGYSADDDAGTGRR